MILAQVRLDIKINGEQIDPLAVIVHKDAAYRTGKALTARLKETIPRQQFKIPIQAAIGSRIVASESLAGEAQMPAVLWHGFRTHAGAFGQLCVNLRPSLPPEPVLCMCSLAQGRPGKMLWWRCEPQEEAAQEAG